MTKQQALSIAFSCAALYQQNLVGRSLLLVTMNKHGHIHCTEVTFDASNYMHFTGFKVRHADITANHFFRLCLDKRLTERDFDFAPDGTTEMKMRVLPRLMQRNLSARMLGDYNGNHPQLYTEKIAGSVGACIGFVRNSGKGRYVPNTVLEGDVRTMTRAADRIVLTYRKNRTEEHYSEIVYSARNVDWQHLTLPEEYQYLPLPDA